MFEFDEFDMAEGDYISRELDEMPGRSLFEMLPERNPYAWTNALTSSEYNLVRKFRVEISNEDGDYDDWDTFGDDYDVFFRYPYESSRVLASPPPSAQYGEKRPELRRLALQPSRFYQVVL